MTDTKPKPLIMNPDAPPVGADDRLAALGITLPKPAAPVAAYVPTVEANGMLYVSGQVSFQAGQLMVGFCVSLTVTVKLQLAWLPAASVAVQVTGVVPIGKNEPEGGEQT